MKIIQSCTDKQVQMGEDSDAVTTVAKKVNLQPPLLKEEPTLQKH